MSAKLLYFPMAGRAESIRLALALAGIPFENTPYVCGQS